MAKYAKPLFEGPGQTKAFVPKLDDDGKRIGTIQKFVGRNKYEPGKSYPKPGRAGSPERRAWLASRKQNA